MTMLRDTQKNSIWARVREDRDIDDMIFETEQTSQHERDTSDR